MREEVYKHDPANWKPDRPINPQEREKYLKWGESITFTLLSQMWELGKVNIERGKLNTALFTAKNF